jgi:transcriptional regulator with XRE-family HTH domain
MNDLDLNLGGKPLVAEVGRALRRARRRQNLSQREYAQRLGVSKSRLARLESDAGPQSLEMVSQVLMASGFRLQVVDVSDGKDGKDGDKPRSESPEDDGRAEALLELCDAAGRRFPAHLDAHPLSFPPLYWFVRNGGWLTAKPFPQWTYQRRFVPRVPP